jgi:hypothetical protein
MVDLISATTELHRKTVCRIGPPTHVASDFESRNPISHRLFCPPDRKRKKKLNLKEIEKTGINSNVYICKVLGLALTENWVCQIFLGTIYRNGKKWTKAGFEKSVLLKGAIHRYHQSPWKKVHQFLNEC